jgi:hypothetical protein
MSVSLAGRFGSVFDLTGLTKIYWTDLTNCWIGLREGILSGDYQKVRFGDLLLRYELCG